MSRVPAVNARRAVVRAAVLNACDRTTPNDIALSDGPTSAAVRTTTARRLLSSRSSSAGRGTLKDNDDAEAAPPSIAGRRRGFSWPTERTSAATLPGILLAGLAHLAVGRRRRVRIAAAEHFGIDLQDRHQAMHRITSSRCFCTLNRVSTPRRCSFAANSIVCGKGGNTHCLRHCRLAPTSSRRTSVLPAYE